MREMTQFTAMDAKHRSGLAWIGRSAAAQIWSEGVFDMLGLSPTDFAPSLELLFSFIHPEDGFARAVLDTEEGSRLEGEVFFRIVRRDGTMRLVSVMRPAATADGGPDWMCLFDYSNQIEPLGTGTLSMGGLDSGDAGAAGFWGLYAVDGAFTLSESAANLFGIARGERITLAQFLRQADPAEREHLGALFLGGHDHLCCLTVTVRFNRLDDGRMRRLTMTLRTETDAGGRSLGLWGTVADVTAAAERDEDLRRTREMLDACLRQTTEGIAVLDREGRIVSLNPAGCNLLGLQNARGQILWETRPGLIGDRLWHAFRDASGGGVTLHEERFVPAFGRWLDYSLSPMGEQVLLMVRSVDEVHRLKSMVGDMAERCGAAFRAGRVSIWEIDHDNDKVWFSDAAGTLPGSSAMTLSQFRSGVSADDLAVLDEALQIARIDGQCFEVDFTYRRPDGRARHLRVRGSVVEGGLDRRTRYAGLVMSLSDAERREGDSPSRPVPAKPAVLTGSQVRAARGALRWSVRELAEHSDVSVATINRFEAGSKAVTARDTSVAALERVLISSGIEFFADQDGRPALAIGEEAEEISRGQIAA